MVMMMGRRDPKKDVPMIFGGAELVKALDGSEWIGASRIRKIRGVL
jgi:hypothetical protein